MGCFQSLVSSGWACLRAQCWAHNFSQYTPDLLVASSAVIGWPIDFYTDDSQMFIFVEPVQALVDGAMDRFRLCVRDIRAWMGISLLKMNDTKTEVLVIGSRQQVAKVKIPGVAVGDELIAPSVKVRDLGAMFDTEMTMVDHVNAICRSVCHQIRNIGSIRCFLSRDTCKQIVHASVTSRLHFCNALPVGLPDSTVWKLQRCQNMAARVVTFALESVITSHQFLCSYIGCLWLTGCTLRCFCKSTRRCMGLPRVIWWTSSSSTDPVVHCVLPLMATLFSSPGLRPPGVIGPSAD